MPTQEELITSCEAAFKAAVLDVRDQTKIESYKTARKNLIQNLTTHYNYAYEEWAATKLPPEAPNGDDRLLEVQKRALANLILYSGKYPEYDAGVFSQFTALKQGASATAATIKTEPSETFEVADDSGLLNEREVNNLLNTCPKFGNDAKCSLESFFQSLERRRGMTGWDDKKMASAVKLLCYGEARIWLDVAESVKRPWLKTYSLLKPAFYAQFRLERTAVERLSLFDTVRSYHNRDLLNYYTEVQRIVYLLDDSDSKNDDEQMTRRQHRHELIMLTYTAGLPSDLRSKLTNDSVDIFNEFLVIKAVRQYMTSKKDTKPTPASTLLRAYDVSAVQTSPDGAPDNDSAVEISALGGTHPRTRPGGRPPSNNSRPNIPRNPSEAEKRKIREDDIKYNRCFYCHIAGHDREKCRKRAFANQRRPGPPQPRNNRSNTGPPFNRGPPRPAVNSIDNSVVPLPTTAIAAHENPYGQQPVPTPVESVMTPAEYPALPTAQISSATATPNVYGMLGFQN